MPLDPYAALRVRDYRFYAAGSILGTVGGQAQGVAVGWELYNRTHSAMALGYVGLVQFLPALLLVLPAGHLADRFDRRAIIMATTAVSALSSLGLAALSLSHGPILWMYALLFLSSCLGTLGNPSRRALMPSIVPEEVFANAVTWNSTGMQLASIAGPALGGLLIAATHGAAAAFAAAVVSACINLTFTALLHIRQQVRAAEPVTIQTVLAGAHFVFSTRIILAAITMDMFAVLLGGATTLLPVYAKDILRVGPDRLGLLMAAQSAGALVMAVSLAHSKPMKRAGRTLLWSVAGFGMATVVFGFSQSFWLSWAMLFCTGACDNISVVVRHTLVQLRTPDALRGRVSAVNSLFIGTSNQLGGFESGLVASLFSPVVSVVAGGIGTILVVLGVAAKWPELRELKRLKIEDGG